MQLSIEEISAQPGFRSTYQVNQNGKLILISKTKWPFQPSSLALQQFLSPSYGFPQIIQQGSSLEPGVKQQEIPIVITCRCKKSRCLKNYCDCFNAGTACGAECRCVGCQNVHAHFKRERNAILKMGCQCSKSNCRKRYCACHSMGRRCGQSCKCVNCENMDEEVKEEVVDQPTIKKEAIQDEYLFIQSGMQMQKSQEMHDEASYSQ